MSLITEFDECKSSIIEPSVVVKKQDNFPELFVSTFSNRLIESLIPLDEVEHIADLKSVNGKTPIYKIHYKGYEIGFFMSKVGAPASTIIFEELIEMGLKKLILFGTCGVLDSKLAEHTLIIPTSAIRDEGTSYHYLKADSEIKLNPDMVNSIETMMKELNYPYYLGKTWTTDAPYRETRSKVEARKAQGAVVVEMECSAMTAVAQFRNVKFGQFLYSSDLLDAPKWEPIGLSHHLLSTKEKYFALALECIIHSN